MVSFERLPELLTVWTGDGPLDWTYVFFDDGGVVRLRAGDADGTGLEADQLEPGGLPLEQIAAILQASARPDLRLVKGDGSVSGSG